MKLGRRTTYNITTLHANFHPIPRTFSGHLLKYYFGHAAGACKCGWAQNGQQKELGEPGWMQVLKNMMMQCM